jgi:predicted NUDIX family NTP pyrophosphohydrolase
VPLGTVRQAGGKVVHAWAAAGEYDAGALSGATFEVEWPPRSGRRTAFPEVDRAEWFDLEAARRKLLEAQRRFVDRLEEKIGG